MTGISSMSNINCQTVAVKFQTDDDPSLGTVKAHASQGQARRHAAQGETKCGDMQIGPQPRRVTPTSLAILPQRTDHPEHWSSADWAQGLVARKYL
jgi:hypothetical protein